MVLIIGGVAQGKRRFAEERFGVMADEWSDGELFRTRAVIHLETLLKSLEQDEAIGRLKEQLRAFPDTVFVSDEVGCGVVPMDVEERLWRERVGRVLCILAAEADEVWRVIAGIGVRIK